MQFVQHDLGYRSSGEVVEVSLSGSQANVRLLDSSNFQAYRSGRRHQYQGGRATKSPVNLVIPRSGHWYVAVDMQGLRGSVRSSARVLPGPLPAMRAASPEPIAPIGQNVAALETARGDQVFKEWDVFISHASEDKDEIVRPLSAALVAAGLRVWYDEFELRIGDSLRRKIDAGLANSRFGIVVLSVAFFSKNWPQYELDGLVSREVSTGQVILPLWHKVSKADVIAVSPSLADKIARNTSDSTVEEIADEIASVVLATRD